MLRSATLLLVALPLLAASPARSITIDFENFSHGEIVAASLASHPGYTLVVENPNRSFDAAVVFDTGVTGSADSDLEAAFAVGNLADAELGNILILQENDRCTATHCSDPDDEGRRPAGSHTFLLDDVATSFSFDLIDVDDATKEKGRITFFLLESGQVDITVDSFSFADFEAMDPSVEYGDNSANHIDFPEIGPFNAFKIEMGGSGGIDNLHATPIPEPAAAGLLGLGLAGLALLRRRRC